MLSPSFFTGIATKAANYSGEKNQMDFIITATVFGSIAYFAIGFGLHLKAKWKGVGKPKVTLEASEVAEVYPQD
ncbi:hypothetical protein, partial [Oculatella sp. LEGE 06141]|uniref:hypothetical protein n=1 Tax=Oculatella sp. LEGE 06141 TaxID=1828648 RepID=UPI001D14010F